MYKKIIFIFLISSLVISLILIGFEDEYSLHNSKEYSLTNLKELLTQTETMIVCPYNSQEPFKVCENEEVTKTISDKEKIEEIISLINPLEERSGISTMVGAGEVAHAFDGNGNFLLNIFFSPYIGLEKGNSFYTLRAEDNEYIFHLGSLIKN